MILWTYKWYLCTAVFVYRCAKLMLFYSGVLVRYGDVYKTHVFGHPSIVVAGPEAARFVMVDKASSFRQRGLPMIEKLLGSSFFGYQHEKLHASFRKILHGPFLPEALERSIPIVEAIAIDILKQWDGKTINTLEEAKKVLFSFQPHNFA